MEDPQNRLVGNLLAYLVQRNVAPEQLEKAAGLPVRNFTQPRTERLTPKQMEDVWRNAVYLTGDPLLGLHFGESLQLAALGIVGQLIQTSRTIGEAFTQAAAFTQLVTNLFRMEVSHSVHSFTLHFILQPEQQPASFVLRQMVDFFMAFTLHEADGLVLEKIKPLTIILPYELDSPAEYERVLRGRPVIEPGTCSLEFARKYWETPILTADYELQGHLLRKADAARHELASAQKLRDRISNYLLTNA